MEKESADAWAPETPSAEGGSTGSHPQIGDETDESDQAPEDQHLDDFEARCSLPDDFGHRLIPSTEAVQTGDGPASEWPPRMNLFFVCQNPGTIRPRDAS